MTAERQVCTRDHPMPQPCPGGQWEHPEADEVGEQENGWPGGDIITVRCPICGEKWKEELPQ